MSVSALESRRTVLIKGISMGIWQATCRVIVRKKITTR